MRHRKNNMLIGAPQDLGGQFILPLHSLNTLTFGAPGITASKIHIALFITPLAGVPTTTQRWSLTDADTSDQFNLRQIRSVDRDIFFTIISKECTDTIIVFYKFGSMATIGWLIC